MEPAEEHKRTATSSNAHGRSTNKINKQKQQQKNIGYSEQRSICVLTRKSMNNKKKVRDEKMKNKTKNTKNDKHNNHKEKTNVEKTHTIIIRKQERNKNICIRA